MPKIIPFSRGMMLLQMSIQSSQSGKNSNEKPTEMFKPTATDTNEKPTEMFKPTATDTNYELSNTIVDKGGEINDLGEISISEIQEIEIEEDQPNIEILNDEFIQNIVADNYVKSDMDISKICTETDMDELDMDDSVRDPDWVQHSSTDDDDDDSDTLLDRPPVINLQVPGEKRPKQKGIEWESTKNKRLRMEGKKYQGLKKVDGHYKFCNERKDRILKPNQCTDTCRKGQRKCHTLTEEVRENIFKGFWEHMAWKEKKLYVSGLVDSVGVKERTTNGDSRRKNTYKYYLKVNDQRLLVCKSKFLSTLCLGEKMVYEWLDDVNNNGIPVKSPEQKQPTHGKEKGDSTREFLNCIPKLPSHYCRSSSTKLYLEPIFSTKADLYKVYKEYCDTNNKVACGRKLFFKIFDELNLSLFSPKKDQCGICTAYEVKNVSEEVYTKHIQKKESAREEKQRDKDRALQDKSLIVLTLDLQSLLMCPKLEASALYYKTKLGCHNYTIFNVASKDVKCYFWHESEGDLSANSFASCLSDYLESVIDESIKEVITYSDGCSYQNRNVIIAQALLRLATKNNVTIVQKVLERGHTQMECDSIHSVIERKIKNKPIYSPQNYVDKIREARVFMPYRVDFVSHEFFKDFSKLQYYSSIRPGTKVGDPVVTDLRVIKYRPDGLIEYKLNYGDDFSGMPRRAKIGEPTPQDQVPNLHTDSLPIKKKKFEHLQQLKFVIPKDYHSFYDNLPHEN